MRYGCHNRPDYAAQVLVQSGWTEDGRRNMVSIPFTMAQRCQYDFRATDPQCAGCARITEEHDNNG